MCVMRGVVDVRARVRRRRPLAASSGRGRWRRQKVSGTPPTPNTLEPNQWCLVRSLAARAFSDSAGTPPAWFLRSYRRAGYFLTQMLLQLRQGLSGDRLDCLGDLRSLCKMPVRPTALAFRPVSNLYLALTSFPFEAARPPPYLSKGSRCIA